MPNRILRDGILDSVPISSLSDQGILFYYRLFSVVDDFGRFDANPGILRARLFPLMLERWPVERIQAALKELSAFICEDGFPIVLVYISESKQYLEVKKFNQRIREHAKSKYPAPSARDVSNSLHPAESSREAQQPAATGGNPQQPAALSRESPPLPATGGENPPSRARTSPTPHTTPHTDEVLMDFLPRNGSMESDEDFMNFKSRYFQTGGSFVDEDFIPAYEFVWKKLDWEQRLARMKGLEDHMQEYSANPRYVKNPQAFLEVEWKRPLRPPPSRLPTRADAVRSEVISGMEAIDRLKGRI